MSVLTLALAGLFSVVAPSPDLTLPELTPQDFERLAAHLHDSTDDKAQTPGATDRVPVPTRMLEETVDAIDGYLRVEPVLELFRF